MGYEIKLHQRLTDPLQSEEGHHLPQSFRSAIQIVGSHGLVYQLENNSGSKDVVCTKRKERKNV